MMGQYKLVVLTRPVEGREDQYNDWYTNTHLDEVLAVPGMVAAQRFRMADESALAPNTWKYCSLYEIEHDDPKAVIADMTSRATSGRMTMTDALDMDIYSVLYEPITPRKTSK